MSSIRLSREDIASFIPNPRARAVFENMQQTVEESAQMLTLNVAATDTLNNAAFVTLSANAELPNERTLQLGEGLDATITDNTITLGLSLGAAKVQGGFRLTFIASGDSQVAVPLVGILATRTNIETFENKTLDQPKLSGLASAADDSAAATAGVPVGGMYRDGSTLKVRVA